METLSKYKTEPNFYMSSGMEDELADKWDWIILPTARNRDSDLLSESNFTVALQMLSGEGDKVEVHRFGHWACGYYEIIAVHPDLARIAEEIEAALDGYPILDDEHFSELEHETAYGDWGSIYGGQGEFAEFLAKEYGLGQATLELLQDSGASDETWTLAMDCDCDYYATNEGISWDYKDHGLTRDGLAKAIAGMRRTIKKAS